nr:MAG TPA: hypothetical protein [Caudoviricetes sp.]
MKPLFLPYLRGQTQADLLVSTGRDFSLPSIPLYILKCTP